MQNQLKGTKTHDNVEEEELTDTDRPTPSPALNLVHLGGSLAQGHQGHLTPHSRGSGSQGGFTPLPTSDT